MNSTLCLLVIILPLVDGTQLTWSIAERLNDGKIVYDADVYGPEIRMKEVDQFRRLVEAIRERNSADYVEQISETFQSLSVVGTAKSPTVKGQRRVFRRH